MDRPPPIFRYSPLSEYKAPSERAARTARRLRRIWKTATAAFRDPTAAAGDGSEGLDPEAALVAAEALPRFEVEAAADALAEALDGWREVDSTSGRVRVVVGPPGSHVDEVAAELARRERWRELEPPSRADLLVGPGALRGRTTEIEADAGEPAFVRRLERWFLRSERALPSTRLLLAALRRRPSPVLVSCDSWAWAFLDSALGASDLLGEPLALAPLEGGQLERWLGPPMRSQGLTCRPRDEHDELVFDGDRDTASRVLGKLAAVARGNPGVALELWRRSLRRAADREDTVWALPAADSELDLPRRLGAEHDFVLHAILLHGGLERDLLLEALPLPRHDVLRRLEELRDAGIVAQGGGEVSIPLAAYVPVRQRLAEEGFLVDGF